jgi:hypothetical protein
MAFSSLLLAQRPRVGVVPGRTARPAGGGPSGSSSSTADLATGPAVHRSVVQWWVLIGQPADQDEGHRLMSLACGALDRDRVRQLADGVRALAAQAGREA